MSTPKIFSKLFKNSGVGPDLNGEIITTAKSTVLNGSNASDVVTRGFFDIGSVYVDATNGNDSNDGLTANTAFKTITAAINKVNHLKYCNINIASGTYNEVLLLNSVNLNFVLLGNVTLNGRLEINRESYLEVNGNYTLTITNQSNRCLFASRSFLNFNSQLAINCTNTGDAIRIVSFASATFEKNVVINCTSVTRAICVRDHASVNITGTSLLTIQGSNITYGIRAECAGICYIVTSATIQNTAQAIIATSKSYIEVNGEVTAYGSALTGTCYITVGSSLAVNSSGNLKLIHSGSANANSSVLTIAYASSLNVSGTLDLSNTASTGCLLRALCSSELQLSGANKFNGIISNASIYLMLCSSLGFEGGTTFTNSTVTGTGKRYILIGSSSFYRSSHTAETFIPAPTNATVSVSDGSEVF